MRRIILLVDDIWCSKMYVKVLIVATLLCTLQCSVEVESFEFIKNAFKGVATKVHNIIHPNHIHDSDCKHTHEETIVTSTSYPEIDIRRGGITSKPITFNNEEKIVFPEEEATTTVIPDINGKALIGAPCPSGTRSVNGQCRAIAG